MHAPRRIGDPQRGDVATFSSPRDGERLIKRIVGLPGDTIEMRGEVLYVNGKPCRYSGAREVREPVEPKGTTEAIRATEALPGREHAVQFLPEVPALRDIAPTVVPPDHFYVLGDNRDNSADSRYIGLIPRKLLIGRAHHVLVSADIQGHWLPRLERFAAKID